MEVHQRWQQNAYGGVPTLCCAAVVYKMNVSTCDVFCMSFQCHRLHPTPHTSNLAADTQCPETHEQQQPGMRSGKPTSACFESAGHTILYFASTRWQNIHLLLSKFDIFTCSDKLSRQNYSTLCICWSGTKTETSPLMHWATRAKMLISSTRQQWYSPIHL